jgi:hypothetical protein
VIYAFITLRFAQARKQERENYRPFIGEVLGDALLGGHPNYREGETRADRDVGWIVDDTDEHWQLSFDVNRSKGTAATTIRLLYRPEGGPVEDVVFTLGEAPPSKNSSVVRSWKDRSRSKQYWQAQIIGELERLRLPRPLTQPEPIEEAA